MSEYRIHTETCRILLYNAPEISESVPSITSDHGNYTTLSYDLHSFLGLPWLPPYHLDLYSSRSTGQIHDRRLTEDHDRSWWLPWFWITRRLWRSTRWTVSDSFRCFADALYGVLWSIITRGIIPIELTCMEGHALEWGLEMRMRSDCVEKYGVDDEVDGWQGQCLVSVSITSIFGISLESRQTPVEYW